MFAPPVAKPKAMQPQRATLVAQRPSQSAVSQAHLLQRSTGNQAERATARTPDHATTPFASFDKIPVFSRDCAELHQNPPVFPARRLAGRIQAKLKIGAVDDPLEHEADRVADQVMRVPAPDISVAAATRQIDRKCAACEAEEERLQTKPAGPRPAEVPGSVHAALSASGKPLDGATRTYFESRFRHDFSAVRVHAGGAAAQSARDVNARAYTSGHDMVFDSGQFAPSTHEGRRLIAHELTHVVQQTSPHASRPARLQRRPRNSGQREETIEVSWSEDEDKFYDRVLAALGRSAGFRGIDAGTYNAASATEHMLYDLVRDFRAGYHQVFHRQPRTGEAVKLHLSAFYDRSEDSLTGKKISFVADAAAREEVAKPVPASEAPAACTTARKANETDSERTTREIEESSCFIARFLLTGDRQNSGFANITVTSEKTYPSNVVFGGRHQRPTGKPPLSYTTAYAAARNLIDGFHVTTAHTPSVIEIEFSLVDGLTVEHARTTPLPPKRMPAAPAEEAGEVDDSECDESDVDYGECLRMERAEAYREGIAAAEEEFKAWYDPYGISGGGGGGGVRLPLPGPAGRLKIPKAARRLSKFEKLQRINRSASMAMKELAGGIHGIRGRLKGQAIAVVEVEVGTTIRYAAATNSGAGWSRRQTALLRGLNIEQIPANLSELVHAEGNVRAWVDGLKKSGQQVRVKRWGMSAGITGKYICAPCRQIARDLGGIIEEF